MAVNNRTITVKHDGETYYGHVATITSTSLGIHEHYGIFTADLTLEWTGAGVSLGGFCLDTPITDKDDTFLGREGSAYGLDYIMQVLSVVGVNNWEELKDRQVIALFDTKNSWGSQIKGIASLTDEKVFIPAAHAEEWLARDKGESK